jgi:hypothetical protein
MADDASPKPEPEIVAPTPIPPRREPPRDPGMIEGEATEIKEEAPPGPTETEAAPAAAPAPEGEPGQASAAESPAEPFVEPAFAESSAEPSPGAPAAEPPAEPPPAELTAAQAAGGRRLQPPSLKLVFAAAAIGAIVGAALAIGAGWLVNPRAAALGAATARISALERAGESRADADAELAKRLAAVDSGVAADAKTSALNALADRVAALERAAGAGPSPSPAIDEALAEARAARDAAAKALALAGAAPQAAPAAAASPTPPVADAAGLAALAGRVGALESAVATLKSAAPDAAAINGRLAKLESALAAPKSEARVAAADAQAPRGAAAAAILAAALEERLEAGAPFAPEWTGLSRLGADAGRLAALKPYADAGAPKVAALAAAFAKLEPALTAAATPAPPPSDEGVVDRLLDHIRALVRVRKVGAVGEGAEGSPAAVAAALGRGDLAAALDAYARLPEAARQAGADWAKSAAARQAASAAARALRDDAVARLAAGD